jgi:CHAD domain-containing protein
MNGAKPSSGDKLTGLRARLAEWCELLNRCGRKPTRKRVHVLRVVTLRMQAELANSVEGLPSASHQVHAILDFGGQSEKLRHALGRVREIDVWIGMLQRLRTSMSETTGYIPRSTRDCIRQMEQLEEHLGRKRRSNEKTLVAEIEKRRDALLSIVEEVRETVGGHGDPHPFEQILARFAAATADFPALDRGNLHEFRKRIKTVRYLAELSPADAACSRLAVQMKKVQTTIGEWHDWDSLAQAVPRWKHLKNAQLAELLDTIAAESFEAAIATCHNATARLVRAKEPQNATATPSPRRKPPARAPQDPVAAEKVA